MPIKVRVGQTDAIKILSSAGGGSVESFIAKNVIGGIASVTSLNVTGISTFNGNIDATGVSTFNGNVSIGSSILLESNGQASFTGFTTFQSSEFNDDVFIRNPAGNTIIFKKDEGDAFFNGIVTATTFSGDISGIASSARGLIGSPDIDVSNIVGTALSIGGAVTATTFSGIITTAAQPNITSVGTLSSLNISGIATVTDTLKVGTAITASGGIITATTFKGSLDGNAGTAGGLSGTPNITIENLVGSASSISGIATVTDTLKVGTAITASGGIITATTFKGSLDGNAGTATSLANSRTIGGVSFDGTANIDLPGVNTAGDQDTSGNAGGLTGTPSITVQDITAETVSIGGTLSYEDVTNVDSVGIITARTGVRISTGGLIVTSGVSTFSGIATFTQNVFVEGTLTAELIDGGVF